MANARPIDDPDLIAELEKQSQQGQKAVDDPDLVRQLEASAAPLRSDAEKDNEDAGFFGTTRNIGAGFLQGIKTAAQPIAAALNPEGKQIDLFSFAKRPPLEGLTPGQSLRPSPDADKDYVNELVNGPNSFVAQALGKLGKSSPWNTDPYQAMGTSRATDLLSRKGAEQAMGEFGVPGAELSKLLVKGARKLPDIIDLFRPTNTANKMVAENVGELQKNYLSQVDQQQKAYDVPMSRYGNTAVTSTPEGFLNLTDDQVKALGPDAKSLLRQFNDAPTLQNLHQLQSQIGKDANRLNPTTRTYKIQTLKKVRDDLTDKVEDFLRNQNDPEAFYNYEHGKMLTRDQVKPYEATPTLRRIVKQNIQPENLSFEQLKKALISASEKGENIIDPATGNITRKIGGVPQDHFINSLIDKIQEQSKMIGRRKMAQKALFGGTPLLIGEEMLRHYLSK